MIKTGSSEIPALFVGSTYRTLSLLMDVLRGACSFFLMAACSSSWRSQTHQTGFGGASPCRWEIPRFLRLGGKIQRRPRQRPMLPLQRLPPLQLTLGRRLQRALQLTLARLPRPLQVQPQLQLTLARLPRPLQVRPQLQLALARLPRPLQITLGPQAQPRQLRPQLLAPLAQPWQKPRCLPLLVRLAISAPRQQQAHLSTVELRARRLQLMQPQPLQRQQRLRVIQLLLRRLRLVGLVACSDDAACPATITAPGAKNATVQGGSHRSSNLWIVTCVCLGSLHTLLGAVEHGIIHP